MSVHSVMSAASAAEQRGTPTCVVHRRLSAIQVRGPRSASWTANGFRRPMRIVGHGAHGDGIETEEISDAGANVYARLDHGRVFRTGFPEIIWGPGKSSGEILGLLVALSKRQETAACTRVTPSQALEIKSLNHLAEYDPSSHLLTMTQPLGARPPPPVAIPGRLLVVSAGTADSSVAAEACYIARLVGISSVRRLNDVGVAGLHRLLDALRILRAADVIIVCAGMDGALPSVVGGLVCSPVIALPTSIGYGAAFGGVAALLAALNSCSSGVATVNIDNGYGAALLAAKILRCRMAGLLEDQAFNNETSL